MVPQLCLDIQSNSKAIIVKILFTVACLQATVLSFGQTEAQKQMMYEHINRDSRGVSIMAKIEPLENKEALFSKAQVLPVYQVVFGKTNTPKLVKNERYYLVFYIGRLYVFINDKSLRLFENSPIIQNISRFNAESKEFKIVYFTASFSFSGEDLNPLITDKNLSFIIDKETRYSTISEYIDTKYGSLEKYKERAYLDSMRDRLSADEVVRAMKNSYITYQYNCPKDTTLVLKKMIDWVNQATGGITKGQEYKLTEQIKIKIDPVKYMGEIAGRGKIKDSIFNNMIKKAQKENEDANKKVIKFIGDYDFSIYDVNVTNELAAILTNQQFINYKNFVDIMYPISETSSLFRGKRYYIFDEVLERQKFFNTKNPNEENVKFKEYFQKILTECGCPFDTSVKREIKII